MVSLVVLWWGIISAFSDPACAIKQLTRRKLERRIDRAINVAGLEARVVVAKGYRSHDAIPAVGYELAVGGVCGENSAESQPCGLTGTRRSA